MAWKLPRLQFGLRGLLLLVLACAIGAWLYTNRPERMRAYRNQQARARIDPYELAIAGEGDSVPPELVAILGDSRLKHWGEAGGVKLLAGDQLMSSGRDEQIRIWNINTGQQLHKLDAKSFTVSGDRKLAFFAAADGTIRCWDVATAKVLKTLGEPRTVDRVGMAASLDGRWLVAELARDDQSREIVVWDVDESRVVHSFRPDKPGGGALSITADGKLFMWESGSQVQISESATGNVLRKVGPIRSGDSRYSLGGVQLSPDESKLFVGNASFEVVLFDLGSGEELERIGFARSGVHNFAVGSSGRAVIFGGQDDLRMFRKWGERGWRYWEGSEIPSGRLGSVDWHGQIIAGGAGDGIALWRSGQSILPWRLQGGPARTIRRIAFHSDGRHLVVGDVLGDVTVHEMSGWQQVRRWNAHGSPIELLAIAANGSRMITAATDGTAVVWDPNTGTELSVRHSTSFMNSHRQIGLSPDGKYGVAGPRELVFGKEFEVFDAATGTLVRKASPIQVGLFSPPVWSPDGRQVAFVDHSQSLLVFDTSSWKNLGSIGKTRFSQQEVVAVWLADNRRLVTTNWGRDEIHLLEVGKPLPVLTLHTGAGQAECVAVHPSEDWIAVCGRATPVQLWHLPTSKLVKFWQIGPPGGLVSQVAFSPDGHYLATVNGNGTVYVLSLDGVLD